ncbi:MAG: MAPEG family protein [Bradyrhizobium sp.]
MSVQMVLLPVFIQIGLTFALLFAMATARTRTLASGETRMKDIALREPNWPSRATQFANCFANQFELPVLFYVLIAIALPLHRADLFIVLMSWAFVVTRFAHAGVFVTSNDVRPRSLAWFAGVLVLAAMWLYFALRLLLLI